MDARSFFLDDRLNFLAAVVALLLFVAGGLALTQRQGVAGIFLFLGGFVATMFLEYRHIDGAA